MTDIVSIKELTLILKIIGRCDVKYTMAWFGFMVFNATFNNISVISWHKYTMMPPNKTITLALKVLHYLAYIVTSIAARPI